MYAIMFNHLVLPNLLLLAPHASCGTFCHVTSQSLPDLPFMIRVEFSMFILQMVEESAPVQPLMPFVRWLSHRLRSSIGYLTQCPILTWGICLVEVNSHNFRGLIASALAVSRGVSSS